MKKYVAIVCSVCISIVFAISSHSALAEQPNLSREAVFVFPSALEVIEEEAFEDTAVKTIVFQYGFLYLGENAFKDAESLRDAFIPDSVEYIAEFAFPQSNELVIHGVEGSSAQEWAKKHQVAFTIVNIWYVDHGAEQELNTQGIPIRRFIEAIHSLIAIAFCFQGVTEDRSRRPQDRPELNPIEYRFP